MYGLKRSQTNMKSQLGNFNPACADVGKYLRSKVQSRCWRGHAASSFRASIDCLVALAVFRPVFARDIGRQRHVAQLLHGGKEIWHRIKTQGALAEFAAHDH